MKAQVMGFAEVALNDADIYLGVPTKEKIQENVNVKALSCRQEKKKVVLYIEKIIKRFFDICGGLVGTLILIPLVAIVYIANRISGDKGKIFYSHERIGKNGKLFKMYKFRSMVEGADEILFKYLAENEEARKEYEEYKKLKNDPRITKVGKFLRTTSLDEFPQLINVLKGEMSLVGPRPYLPREKEDMGEIYETIVSMKPGVTGYWQVAGRSDVTFKERLIMDIRYYQRLSLKIDLKLLFATVKRVVKKEGAI